MIQLIQKLLLFFRRCTHYFGPKSFFQFNSSSIDFVILLIIQLILTSIELEICNSQEVHSFRYIAYLIIVLNL